jgi:F-type H+-transporting ATPase subunit b
VTGMHIDWWTLGFQTINAVVLIWILSRFLFRPVADIIVQRQKAVSKLVDDAAEAKTQALIQQESATAENLLVTKKREQLIQAASVEAQALKEKLDISARAEADQLRIAAEEHIVLEREKAALATTDYASLFALDIAARLLERLPKTVRVTSFIQGLADALGNLSDSTRMQTIDSNGSLRLISACPLTPEDLDACRVAFKKVLGKDLPIEISIDPSIVAGLELETTHGIVRNSFRHDLAQLKLTLLAHDPKPQ